MCLIVLERHSGVVAVELNKLSGHYGQLYLGGEWLSELANV